MTPEFVPLTHRGLSYRRFHYWYPYWCCSLVSRSSNIVQRSIEIDNAECPTIVQTSRNKSVYVQSEKFDCELIVDFENYNKEFEGMLEERLASSRYCRKCWQRKEHETYGNDYSATLGAYLSNGTGCPNAACRGYRTTIDRSTIKATTTTTDVTSVLALAKPFVSRIPLETTANRVRTYSCTHRFFWTRNWRWWWRSRESITLGIFRQYIWSPLFKSKYLLYEFRDICLQTNTSEALSSFLDSDSDTKIWTGKKVRILCKFFSNLHKT